MFNVKHYMVRHKLNMVILKRAAFETSQPNLKNDNEFDIIIKKWHTLNPL